MKTRRRISLGLAVLTSLATVLIAGCGSAGSIFAPQPRTLRISTNQLLNSLGAQFPVKSRVLELADVVASNPRLRTAAPLTTNIGSDTQAPSNRLFTGVDLSLTPTALGQLVTTRSFSGSLELSYGLRLEPSDQSVRLHDVKVESLKIDNLPAGLSKLIEQLGPRITEHLLQDFSVYSFKPQDLKAAAGWGYKPSSVRVDGDGLVVTLEPAKR